MTTQAAPVDAVHAQSRVSLIESVPDPPSDDVVAIEFVRVAVHREAEGAVVDRWVDVQDTDATSVVIASRYVWTAAPELVSFEQPRLMRNLAASRVQFRDHQSERPPASPRKRRIRAFTS